MKYSVIEGIVYQGVTYKKGSVVEIFDDELAKKSVEKRLIEPYISNAFKEEKENSKKEKK